uniref:Cytochrome P450 n=1 Tax=Scoparia dulcis TaxID=107240 RepID=A0A1W7HBP9_SCODU
MELFFFIFFFPAFTFAFMLFNIVLTTKSKSLNLKLPPSPLKMPLIGHLHLFLASSKQPYHVLRDLAVKYGPLMHLQLGEVSTIVVSSRQTAEEIFSKQDLNFSYRPTLTAVEIIGLQKGVAFSPYGEYWRQLKKIFIFELLTPKRVQSFRPVREEEITGLCRWIASKEGCVLNLATRVESTMYDIVTRACLGKKTAEATVFLSKVKQGIKISSAFVIADLYPSTKFPLLTRRLRRKAQRLTRERDSVVTKIIADHQANVHGDADSINAEHEDLVNVVLKFLQGDAKGGLALDTEIFKYLLVEIFAATIIVSTTIEWSISELFKHPKDLTKAQDEVRRVYGGHGYVDESLLHELKYLKLVIKEGLRLHPPLPLLLPRENKDPCVINGYDIPAKTRLLINVWALGRDTEYWGKDAESFMPERFLDDCSHIDYKSKNYEFLPFGGGRRICPGKSLGLVNIELVLAMLLYHFDWVMPNGMKFERLDMTETLGVVSRRKKPLYVIPVVKIPLPSGN